MDSVLANEQINNQGFAERSGAKVERKNMNQWFFKITDYAKDLYKDLDSLDWPESVKIQQRNWIMPKHGLLMTGNVIADNSTQSLQFDNMEPQEINCFLEYGDVNIHPSFVMVGPEHAIVSNLPKSIQQQCQKIMFERNQTHDVKMGINTGLIFHQLDHSIKIPIFISPSMAILAFPTINDSHKAFALNNNIEISKTQLHYSYNDAMPDNKVVHYQLRDWLVSRQRYWGTPIPIIHCNSCGAIPVPIEDLPVILPESKDELNSVPCPKCGNKDAKREQDTMDTFVDSSWYWIRYLDNKNDKRLVDHEKAKHLPVDIYIGGIEHAIMHLLYARFIGKFLNDQNIINIPNGEPFKKLLNQGMVTGKTYRDSNGTYLPESQVDFTQTPPVNIKTKQPVTISFEKMSKSKYNGVDPIQMIEKYGSDITRLFILYKAAPQDELVWDEQSIKGMERFLNKLQIVIDKHTTSLSPEHDPDIVEKTNHTLNQVTLKYF
ncbi:hypothetical protein HDV02_000395 [Globomyces sp. JEL0801]|nr:hypothetical protein HDV02_000395 [Globomyces sp. JEL0801]